MKKIILLLVVSIVVVLAACGNESEDSAANASDDKTISFIGFDNPAYVEATEIAKKEAEKLGYTLDVTYMNDIIQPNEAVSEKEAFGNWFQHVSYLEQYNKDHSANLVPTFDIYIDTAGLYSKKIKDVKQLKIGSIVAIPVDPANNGRALFMLQDLGLLTLKQGVTPVTASLKDIEENPLNLKFREVDQLMLSRTINDVDLAFIFASTLSRGELDDATPIVVENDEEQLKGFMETVAVHKDNLSDEKVEILRKAFQNDAVKKSFEQNFPNVILGW